MNDPIQTPTRRLKTIVVAKLFGVFDHRIELNEERITIIHGPNGFGKTAILRLVAGLFERHYSMLRTVPFESVNFTLDDGTEIQVRQTPAKSNLRTRIARPELRISSKGQLDWPLQQQPEVLQEIPIHLIDEQIPWLQRTSNDLWFDPQTGEQLDVTDIFDRYAEYLPTERRADSTPPWLRQIQDSVNVYLIRANRLDSTPSPRSPRMSRRRPAFAAPAVATFALELADRIQSVQSLYAKLSQTLDRSFPSRIMSANRESHPSLSEIRTQLADLDQQRRDLNQAGLLEQESPAGIDQILEPDESQLGVLSVYIADVNEKLGVFRDLRRRIELFSDLLNRRFHFKQVRIDKSQGLVFQTDSGQELPSTALSTGEQHEVVMLYQLLFVARQNSLILIDEPEISLHVAWQEPFLKDLGKITAISQLDFLIATHSPQIIDDRWDLTVELKGPQR